MKAITTQSSKKVGQTSTKEAFMQLKVEFCNFIRPNGTIKPQTNDMKTTIKMEEPNTDLNRREQVINNCLRVKLTHFTHYYLISKEPRLAIINLLRV